MASIRILHASDFHISTRASYISGWDFVSPGVTLLGDALKHPFATARRLRRVAFLSTYDPDPLGAFARLVYDVQTQAAHNHELRTPVDAVVLTGDIATSGLERDLKMVREFLQGPVSGPDPVVSDGGFPTLARVNEYADGDTPVWILPGNHDRYRRVRSTLNVDYSPGGRNFEKVLGSYWGQPFPDQPHWGPDVVEFPTLSKDGLNVTIIAADFNLRHKHDRVGPWHHKYAQGRVYPDIVEELRRATESARDSFGPPHAVLWAVHFPPRFPGISDEMRLIDEDSLVEAAESQGVTAIMSGHTHEQLEYPISNPRPEGFCGGTTAQHFAPLGNRLRVIEVGDDARGNVTVLHEHYLYDDLAEDFLMA